MIDLDIAFGDSPWEQYLAEKAAGDAVSAAQLLALLEGESEEAVEDAMELLESRGLALEVGDLPRTCGSGEASIRLRREMELAKARLNPKDLEPGDPLRLYLEEIAQLPTDSDAEALAARCAAGDEDAMLALTNRNLERVVTLAREYVGFGVLLLDLIQEGSLGLWQSVHRSGEGNFASLRDDMIRLYMARTVLLQARANGVGQKLRSAMEDFRQVDERLLGDLGRNPTLEEIAAELHMAPEQAAAVQRALENASALARAKEPQPDEEAAQEQAVEDTALFQSRARVQDLLSGLDDAQSRLLTLRFGLAGGKPMSLAEAGKALGLTPEEAGTLESAALAKLRGTQNETGGNFSV